MSTTMYIFVSGYVVILIFVLDESKAHGGISRVRYCKSNNKFLTNLPNGTEICSRCRLCPIGQGIEIPCYDFNDTVCRPCPKGTFSHKLSKRCHQCKTCPPGHIVLKNCTETKNTACRKCRDHRYLSTSQNKCVKCTFCPPGTRVVKMCSTTEDTECKTCPPDTYTDIYDTYPYCKMCSICRRFERTIQRCNRTHDTICGECQTGYFRLESSRNCVKCAYCYRNVKNFKYTVIDECAKNTNNSDYSCMPVDIPPYQFRQIILKQSVKETKSVSELHNVTVPNTQIFLETFTTKQKADDRQIIVVNRITITLGILTSILLLVLVVVVLTIHRRVNKGRLLSVTPRLRKSQLEHSIMRSSLPTAQDDVIERYNEACFHSDSLNSEIHKYHSDPSLSQRRYNSLMYNAKRIHSMSDSADFKSIHNFYLSIDMYSHFTPKNMLCFPVCLPENEFDDIANPNIESKKEDG